MLFWCSARCYCRSPFEQWEGGVRRDSSFLTLVFMKFVSNRTGRTKIALKTEIYHILCLKTVRFNRNEKENKNTQKYFAIFLSLFFEMAWRPTRNGSNFKASPIIFVVRMKNVEADRKKKQLNNRQNVKKIYFYLHMTSSEMLIFNLILIINL